MNDIAVIHFENGGFAIIDSFAHGWVSLHKWYSNVRDGYPFTNLGQKTISLGKFLLNPGPELTVDHKNGNFLDNRFSNLREATFKQNQHNQGKRLKNSATSKYKGVYWSKDHNSWRAQIRVDGRKWHLGTFKTQEQAAMCYNDAAYRNFGEFARLNEIQQEPPIALGETKEKN